MIYGRRLGLERAGVLLESFLLPIRSDLLRGARCGDFLRRTLREDYLLCAATGRRAPCGDFLWGASAA